jgi:hypothetical protein
MNIANNHTFSPRFVYPNDLDERYQYVSDSQDLYDLLFYVGQLDLRGDVTAALVTGG